MRIDAKDMLGRALPEVDSLTERPRLDAQDFDTVDPYDSAGGPIAMIQLDRAGTTVQGQREGGAAHWWDNESGGWLENGCRAGSILGTASVIIAGARTA